MTGDAPKLVPSPFLGVPSFFRACCLEAARGINGGYANAGFHLAIHITGLHDGDHEDPAYWPARLAELHAALGASDRLAVIAWFRAEFPKCMRLVPSRRRSQFVDGVFRAFEDGRVGE